MFRNREDAALKLVKKFEQRDLKNPIVLGVPRGGVVLAAVLAQELNADLDVLLARKLRAPYQPELAIGAIGEAGNVYLYHPELVDKNYLEQEKKHQFGEIQRRRELVNSVAPAIPLKDRSVIVTDDGIATGSTMIAGLQTVHTLKPFEIILAVPVAHPDTLKRIRKFCDDIICLSSPNDLRSVGQFYDDFAEVSDAEMINILGNFGGRTKRNA